MNQCDICELTWDPRNQEHRRGIDCGASLKDMIKRLDGVVTRLRLAYQKLEEDTPMKEKAILESFSSQRDSIESLTKRLDEIAKRVNLLEHPKLSKVPSMPRIENDKKY